MAYPLPLIQYPEKPTCHRIGSREKIELLILRASLGLPLHVVGDTDNVCWRAAKERSSRAVNYRRRPGYIPGRWRKRKTT